MSRGRRICFIIDNWFPQVGGGPVYVLQMANLFTKKYNCQVTILTRKIKGETIHPDIDPKIVLNQVGPSGTFQNIILRIIFLIKSTVILLFGSKYDLYLPQSILPGITGWIVKKILHKPVILTVHGTILGIKQNVFSIAWQIENIILTKIRYNGIISVSKSFLQISNVNQKISVIPNGVDVKVFDAVEIKKSTIPIILYVGRFDKIKGIHLLLLAFKHIINQFPKCKLHLVGYGYEESNLKILVNNLGLRSRVFFLGKLYNYELIKEYKSSEIFVLPSLSEGFPLTLLEAWASKLPVIATNVGDNAQLIENGKNGFIIQSNDVEELQEKILFLLQNPKAGRHMGLQGSILVKNNYSWIQTADQTFQTINKYLT